MTVTTCTHAHLVTYEDYCPHKGFSRDLVCKDCNKLMRYYAGQYFEYHGTEPVNVLTVDNKPINKDTSNV
jgi:hypothetical protein